MAVTEAATDPGISSRRSQEHDDEIVEVALDVERDLLATEDVREIDEDEPGHGGGFGGLSLGSPSSSRRGNLLSKLTQVTISKGLMEADELEEEGATGTTGKERVEEVGQKLVGVALKSLQLVSAAVGHADWATAEQRFDQLQVDAMLPRSRFGECIGMEEGSESDERADKVFDSLSRKRGMVPQALTKDELKDFWEQLSDQSFDNRLQTFFDMVDRNADGRITSEEVKEIIKFGVAAKKASEEQVDEYTALIMEQLNSDNLQYIKLEDLKELLLQSPSQAAARSTAHSSELSKDFSKSASNKDCWQNFKYFLEENWQRIWVMTLWLSICIGLFIWKFIQYRDRVVFYIMGYCVSTAKGGAEIIKFNMALVLLPVCRNTITWIRSKTKIGAAVPFDDNINFHKIIAVGVAVGVGLHAGPHLTCNFPRLLHASEAAYEPMKPFFGDERPPNYWWFVKATEGWTGVAMVLLMTIAFVAAHPWFRRNQLKDSNPLKKMAGFNAFWFTHHLFVIVYALYIVHGIFLFLSSKWYKKTTWMYLAVPGLLYVSERILRLFRSLNAVRIKKAVIYPGNVLALHMKPRGFKYRSGQYVFINCPDVARYEWHPFSITSAPGDRSLSVHIRAMGDWTKRIKTAFAKECRPPTNGKSGLLRADFSKGNPRSRCPKLFIDGPYGAPAQDYREYDVVLLIGLGIGATPLISIVRDVLNQVKLGRSAAKAKKRPFMTKRAYLHWVTRETGSFEWFQNVMDRVAKKDKNGVLELHIHCTSVYEEDGSRGALIAMLQEHQRAKKEADSFVSRTSVQTHWAGRRRPEWKGIFKRVAEDNENQRIGVFYCGTPNLVPDLRQLSADFNHYNKTKTKFEFHKENF